MSDPAVESRRPPMRAMQLLKAVLFSGLLTVSNLVGGEAIAQKEGILPSGKPAPHLVSALSCINMSGFVTASYFFNSTG